MPAWHEGWTQTDADELEAGALEDGLLLRAGGSVVDGDGEGDETAGEDGDGIETTGEDGVGIETAGDEGEGIETAGDDGEGIETGGMDGEPLSLGGGTMVMTVTGSVPEGVRVVAVGVGTVPVEVTVTVGGPGGMVYVLEESVTARGLEDRGRLLSESSRERGGLTDDFDRLQLYNEDANGAYIIAKELAEYQVKAQGEAAEHLVPRVHGG